MAAYAAVVSLMNTIDAVMNHPLLSTSLLEEQITQIQSLSQKLGVLLHFIENHIPHGRQDKEAECLERKISYAAHNAEDDIESYIVQQIHGGALEEGPSFFINLLHIIQDIDRVEEEVVKFKAKRRSNGTDRQPRYSMTATASSQPHTTTSLVRSFNGCLIKVLDSLTGIEPRLQVIPIVGMCGVGKTTLARNAYENSLIVQYFDVRAWVSISPLYSVRTILLKLLCSLGESTTGIDDENVDDRSIGERLHQFLCGKRYLIALDDMWNLEAWDKIKSFLPENHKSSRIIVTTRLLKVAHCFGISKVVEMALLNEKESWELFWGKACIENEGFPIELEEIGKRIVKKCKGLPLSIALIVSILGKYNKTKEYWEKIARNIRTVLEDHHCLNSMFLSYKHLPAHLKPCFLHLGIFPEDHEINVSLLIKLWVAEGFIKQNQDESSEEIAEGYINDLFLMNLIIPESLGWNKKFASFRIHGLVRELCLREARKENFFCVAKRIGKRPGIDRQRRIVIRPDETVLHTLRSTSTARSLSCEGGELLFESGSLLREVVVKHGDRNCFPSNAFQLVNMRLLAYQSDVLDIFLEHSIGELPRSIYQLWNLQSLIVSNSVLESPLEIWKLPHLRHVEFWLISLTEPARLSDEGFVLHNFQTLMQVEDMRWSEEVCRRIPNVKKLEVSYQDFSEENGDYFLENISRFSKLESLKYSFDEVPDHDHLLRNIKFPACLKELSLSNCGLDWDEDMPMIASLPHLEALKLNEGSFVGWEWDTAEGGFLCLKHMVMDGTNDLENWNAESSHFPVLDTLFLHHLFELCEIPSGIGDIPTLRVIRVEACSIVVAVSAMRILEEQESQGNDDLQIQVSNYEKEEFMKEVEEEGITCRNFKLE